MWKIYLIAVITWIKFLKNGQCQMEGMGMLPGMNMMPGMGVIGGMMAITGGIPPQAYMVLDSAIKQIVSPLASPTAPIVAVALGQGGPPTTVEQMMQYIPHFIMLARQHGVKPPGVVGPPTTQQLQNFILQRSNQWMQANLGFQAMNIDPTIGMATNMMANSMAPAPPPVSAPAPYATGNNTSTSHNEPRNLPSTNTQPWAGPGSKANSRMNGMGGIMQLLAFGGLEGIGVEGLGMGML